MTDEASLPLTGHLTELRNRVIIIIGTILIIFMGTYFFSARILTFVQLPVAGQKLIFLSPTEAFFAHLKVAFFAAIFISLPMTLYQIWRFCAPGLLAKERRYVFPFVFFSTMCFVVGALFCFYLILPFGLQFLMSFATESLIPQISIGFYISFVFKLILVFGITFEIPLVTLLLVQVGFVTPEWLVTNRAYVIVGAFVVAALLTPPDMVTQLLLAGPLIILYEISIIIAKIITRRKKKKAAEEEANRED